MKSPTPASTPVVTAPAQRSGAPAQGQAAAQVEAKPSAAEPVAAPANARQGRSVTSIPGLGVFLIAVTILICIAAAMRLDRPVVRDRAAATAAASLELRINLNTAGEAELQLLPMIGPALAERIVDDREHNGPFTAIDDLARVRGIGRVIIERIAPFASVEP